MSLLKSVTSFFKSNPSQCDLEGGSGSLEMSPLKDYDQELIDEISNVQSIIAPHVERYQDSRKYDTYPDAVSLFAARTSVALTELNEIVHSHQDIKSVRPALDDKTFLKTEEAIDELRHTHLKLHQRKNDLPQTGFVDMGLVSAYQKGQSWLLDASPGTDHADSLLWQFTNQNMIRNGPGVSSRIREGGSRQLWPPTARTMKQTRGYLDPPRKWIGEREVDFGNHKHTLGELKKYHRDRAINHLQRRRGGMTEWERGFIERAVEKSGGFLPSYTEDEKVTAEEEGIYAIGSDDDDEEDEVVSGPSRTRSNDVGNERETRGKLPSQVMWKKQRCACD